MIGLNQELEPSCKIDRSFAVNCILCESELNLRDEVDLNFSLSRLTLQFPQNMRFCHFHPAIDNLTKWQLSYHCLTALTCQPYLRQTIFPPFGCGCFRSGVRPFKFAKVCVYLKVSKPDCSSNIQTTFRSLTFQSNNMNPKTLKSGIGNKMAGHLPAGTGERGGSKAQQGGLEGNASDRARTGTISQMKGSDLETKKIRSVLSNKFQNMKKEKLKEEPMALPQPYPKM